MLLSNHFPVPSWFPLIPAPYQIFAAIFEINPPFPAHCSYTSNLSARSRILRMDFGPSIPEGPSLRTAANTYRPVGDRTP